MTHTSIKENKDQYKLKGKKVNNFEFTFLVIKNELAFT